MGCYLDNSKDVLCKSYYCAPDGQDLFYSKTILNYYVVSFCVYFRSQKLSVEEIPSIKKGHFVQTE